MKTGNWIYMFPARAVAADSTVEQVDGGLISFVAAFHFLVLCLLPPGLYSVVVVLSSRMTAVCIFEVAAKHSKLQLLDSGDGGIELLE